MRAFLQKQNRSQATSHNSRKPGAIGDLLRSQGRPLNKAIQTKMDARFGFDFSRVRIHDGPKAAESAEGLSARAYTVGSEIVFGAGQYSPGTDAGQRLIAHELTHVVQQLTANTAAQGSLLGPVHGPAEREANHVAGAVASGAPMPAISTPAEAWLQRSAISTNERFEDLGDLLHGRDMCEHLACNDVNACQDDANGIECPDGTSHAFKKTNHKFVRHLRCDPECKKAITPCDDSEQVIALPKKRFATSKCGQELTICAGEKSTTATVRERSDRNTWEVSGAVARALGVEPDFRGSVYPEANDPDMKNDRHCTPKPAPAAKPKTEPKKTEGEKK